MIARMRMHNPPSARRQQGEAGRLLDAGEISASNHRYRADTAYECTRPRRLNACIGSDGKQQVSGGGAGTTRSAYSPPVRPICPGGLFAKYTRVYVAIHKHCPTRREPVARGLESSEDDRASTPLAAPSPHQAHPRTGNDSCRELLKVPPRGSGARPSAAPMAGTRPRSRLRAVVAAFKSVDEPLNGGLAPAVRLRMPAGATENDGAGQIARCDIAPDRARSHAQPARDLPDGQEPVDVRRQAGCCGCWRGHCPVPCREATGPEF